MPNLTTHIHFALLFAESTDYDIHLAALVEGAVAPGLHSDKDAYTNAHSLGANHNISREESNTGSLSYRLGYLSHSFLDHYFEAYRTEIFLFKSPIKEERMRAMSMAEQIDIRHMREYETDLMSLSEKYGDAFTALFHTASPPEDKRMGFEEDYENLMIAIVKKFTQFLRALQFTSSSDDLIL